MWYIDQKVVCIKNNPRPVSRINYPWKGNIYTIKDIRDINDKSLTPRNLIDKNGKYWFLLHEIYNYPSIWFLETYFRPLEITKIEDFNHLLNNIPKDIQEDEKNEMINDKKKEKVDNLI